MIRRRTDNPFVDYRIGARERRAGGPLWWLVTVGIVVAISIASPRVSQWWLASRLARDVAAIDPTEMPDRFETLAQLGEPGITVLVGLLGDPRPGVAQHAARALDVAQATWRTRSAAEAERLHHCLVQQLRRTTPRLGDSMDEPCLALLSRVMEECVTAHTADGQDAFREATALVTAFQATGLADGGDPQIPRLALSRSPEVPLVPLSSESWPATSGTARSADGDPPSLGTSGSAVLRVSVGPPTGSGSGPTPRDVARGSTAEAVPAADPQGSASGEKASPASKSDRSPTLRLQPPAGRVEAVQPANGLRPLNSRESEPTPQPAAVSAPPSAVAGADVPVDRSTLRRTATSPERLIRVDAEVTSLEVHPSEIGIPGTLEPYSDREIIDLAGSVQPQLTQMAVDELRRRGFSAAEVEIARGIASPRYAERLALVRTLPTRSDVDPRRWLQWLADDPHREIRHEAVSALATMGDPQVSQWLADQLARENDPVIARTIRASLDR